MDIHRFSYKIQNIELTLDVNYSVKDNTPVYFIMVNDYIDRKFPIIQFSLQLDILMIQKIYKYKDTAKIKLEIIEQEYKDDELISTRRFFQHTFSIIPIREASAYTLVNDDGLASNVDESVKLQAFEMYLIDMDIINIFTKEISTIFKDCSRPAALECLFKMRDIPAKTVIATPPENLSIVDQIVLPIGDLIDNIDLLNKSYGLYTSYPIIYYDLSYLYCIDRITPNIVIPSVVDYDTVTFILKNSTVAEAKIPGGYNDSKSKTHYINLQATPTIIDNSTQINNTQFATIQSVDADGNVSKITLDPNSTKLNYIYKHNELTMEQEVNEKYRTDTTISVIATECPVTIFRPYKQYLFNADTEYSSLKLQNKTFRLSSLVFTLHKNGSNEFIHSVQANLYKI